MDGLPWLIISLVVLGVIVGIAAGAMILRRGKKAEMNGRQYLSFFIIGLAYLAVGISLSFIYSYEAGFFNFFTFLGIIFTAMGLSNIDKWRRKPD